MLGALASGMLLYGISTIYGSTGSLEFARTAESIAAPGPILLTMVLSLVFVVAFKLGAVPFHMWVPDAYEGAPTPVSLFIATAPKSRRSACSCGRSSTASGVGYRLVPDVRGARGAVDGDRKHHRDRTD